jgi:hypothetical protein
VNSASKLRNSLELTRHASNDAIVLLVTSFYRIKAGLLPSTATDSGSYVSLLSMNRKKSSLVNDACNNVFRARIRRQKGICRRRHLKSTTEYFTQKTVLLLEYSEIWEPDLGDFDFSSEQD